MRSETTKEGGPLATARGCRPPIYISTKRSSRPLSFYVNLPQTLWTKPSLNSNFTSISWDSSCRRAFWTSSNPSGWKHSPSTAGKARRTSCIPGQKTDPAHLPPQMAYTRGEKLHGWYKTVNRCTIREVKSARDASAESLNSKMKAFRAQLRGVSDLPFFMYRLSTIFG